ncbi:hypothetical protein NDU88_011502 [Pleurodeles waltl]|uniref:Uncharacterized protein n=1 Tax=Pleurodeles waltl TaxID=8319 RepID=A0AAV7S2T2_PLEWA|nr:hypothetical protein NDU88_011502 [Pleurodeles waltl]
MGPFLCAAGPPPVPQRNLAVSGCPLGLCTRPRLLRGHRVLCPQTSAPRPSLSGTCSPLRGCRFSSAWRPQSHRFFFFRRGRRSNVPQTAIIPVPFSTRFRSTNSLLLSPPAPAGPRSGWTRPGLRVSASPSQLESGRHFVLDSTGYEVTTGAVLIRFFTSVCSPRRRESTGSLEMVPLTLQIVAYSGG